MFDLVLAYLDYWVIFVIMIGAAIRVWVESKYSLIMYMVVLPCALLLTAWELQKFWIMVMAACLCAGWIGMNEVFKLNQRRIELNVKEEQLENRQIELDNQQRKIAILQNRQFTVVSPTQSQQTQEQTS